jgi:phosphotransferase family enzyme
MMESAKARMAATAAVAAASELGLVADDVIVLNDSNRLVLRLLPCDIVARVAPVTYGEGGRRSLWTDYRTRAQAEAEVVRRLAETASPVASLDPRVEARVYERGGFVIAFWTYVERVDGDVPTADYADALGRLHAGLRQIDLAPSHFTDRVADTQQWVASRSITPGLGDEDRALLSDTLEGQRQTIVDRGAVEQLLHGEPHQWNVLRTTRGPLFIDFENCCRGPVEYDLAWVPEDASERYPDVDKDLLGDCRGLMLAIIAAHFCRRDNEHPNERGREEYLGAVRDGPPWPALDEILRRSLGA